MLVVVQAQLASKMSTRKEQDAEIALVMKDVVVFVDFEMVVLDVEMDDEAIWWMNPFLFWLVDDGGRGAVDRALWFVPDQRCTLPRIEEIRQEIHGMSSTIILSMEY